MHMHRAVLSLKFVVPYVRPVREPENPAAHHGRCHIDRCECGSVRLTNRNCGAIEMGKWSRVG